VEGAHAGPTRLKGITVGLRGALAPMGPAQRSTSLTVTCPTCDNALVARNDTPKERPNSRFKIAPQCAKEAENAGVVQWQNISFPS
jgi:hypothetical protein